MNENGKILQFTNTNYWEWIIHNTHAQKKPYCICSWISFTANIFWASLSFPFGKLETKTTHKMFSSSYFIACKKRDKIKIVDITLFFFLLSSKSTHANVRSNTKHFIHTLHEPDSTDENHRIENENDETKDKPKLEKAIFSFIFGCWGCCRTIFMVAKKANRKKKLLKLLSYK